MSEVDFIEMVCDWTAMSQEFQPDDGSAQSWADRVVGTRIHFNEERSRFIYEMIDLLNRQRGLAK